MTTPRSLLPLALVALSSLCMPAQTAAPAHPTSTPYAGDLSIFEEPGRESKLQIGRVMDLLKIGRGSTVADIGAGGGWFTVRAARRVGTEGHVYAEDINPAAVRAIEQRAAKEKLPQVVAVQGTPDDPRLPAGAVQAVLLLKVYHEIAEPATFLRHLKPALAAGARIGIIDRNGNGADHGLQQKVLEREMHDAGFREVEHYDFTKADGQDYFLIFVAE